MKAIAQDVYGPADVLTLRDVDTPSIGDTDVLVEVRAAGVDPGVWVFMTGRPYLVRLACGLRRPRVPIRGRALAGVVTAVGAGVTRFQPGDEVYGTTTRGTYAEYAAAPQDTLAHKPASLTYAQAAAVPVSGQTALQAVRDHGGVTAGARVMVIGAAGGVGSFAVQLAKAYGATVTGVCRPERADLVRSLGAADIIDYTRQEIDCHGPVYDVVIDTAGDRPLSLIRRALTPRGTLALVGGDYRKGGLLAGFERAMVGAPLRSMVVGQRLRNVIATERATDLDELTRLIESGTITPVIDRTYPLAATPDALRHLADGKSDGHPAGKLVVTVNSAGSRSSR